MIPKVKFTKSQFNTGATPPSNLGVAVLIAPSNAGPVNVPSSQARPDLAFASFGDGYLAEFAATVIDEAQSPVVCIRPTTATAASYGVITYTGTGTLGGGGSVTGTFTPVDDLDIQVKFTIGGTTGTAGIYYEVSYDNGQTFSAPIALGVSLVIPINDAHTGNELASFTLVTAKTVVAGDYFQVSTVGPRMTDADLTASLTALGNYGGVWEMVAVAGLTGDATNIGALDTFLAGLETQGKFRWFQINSAMKSDTFTGYNPATWQSEAAFLTALTTAYGGVATSRGGVCVDGCYMTQPLRGTQQRRPAIFQVVAREMSIDFATMSSYVALGPLPNSAQLADANTNPNFHDEALFPGPDDQRLTALRSFDQKPGIYINLPRVLSASGSDYVFTPHIRMMNAGCEKAWQILSNQLSAGVLRDKTTGYILESEAQRIEGLVNAALDEVYKGKISGWLFELSRTDNISSNSGATLSGTSSIEAPAYVTEFDVNTRFVKTITATT